MVTPTNRSPAGLLVCLVDPLSGRRASAARCANASCESLEHLEDSPPAGSDAVYPNREPRFAYLARRRRDPISRGASPDESSPPTKAPVMGRSNEKGMK